MMAKRDHSHTNRDKLCFLQPVCYSAYANGYVVAFFFWCVYCNKIIEKYKNILWSLIM